jgi:hypothetical protein
MMMLSAVKTTTAVKTFTETFRRSFQLLTDSF